MKLIDITGQTFGRYTVLSYAGRQMWHCRCSCGTQNEIHAGNLRAGRTQSCGCLVRDTPGHNTKHGMRDTSEWRAWQGARKRCTEPKHREWRFYGGRGITMDPVWISD